MRAAILAGGKGTRLLPYTIVIPKPMLPVGEVPVIEIIARQLKHHGFEEVTVSLGHMSGVIENFLLSHSTDDLLPKFSFYREDAPLGTSGAVPFLFRDEDKDLLVVNGDVITTLDMRSMFKRHQERNSILTLGIRKTTHTLPLGSVTLDVEGYVTRFEEKPSLEFMDNIGVYVYSRRIREFVGENERMDINVLVDRLMDAGERVDTFMSDGLYYWIDIGTHADYERANKEIDSIIGKMPYMKRTNQ